jgi:hypothetical protein
MAAKKKAKSAAGMVTIRMYRHGLGDCFLLKLPRKGGGTCNILIDCGLIGVASNPKPTMQKVVADIAKECDNRLDVVAVTHEHWDHASGFSTEQAQSEFYKIEFGEVWYAWTEDPKNKLGKKLRKEREAKLAALNRAVSALRVRGTPMAQLRGDRVESILQFFGGPEANLAVAGGLGVAKPKIGKTRLAFDYPGKRNGVQVRYCYPNVEPMTFPDVPGIRVYALGPPEDEMRIKRSAPTKKGKEVYEFGADLAVADNLGAAFDRLASGGSFADSGRDCPFDKTWARSSTGPNLSQDLQNMLAQWNSGADEWRKIDDDWTAAAETLALNLDSHTNNTCLVLAFELIDSGKVLLFAADAQVGNWLSWQDTKWSLKDSDPVRDVVGPDLLKRCTFYKVGHHGSHNATLRALGLEQMTSNDLVAFVPVFKAQAEKNRWMAMPFSPLVKRLKEKTGGRVVFSDDKVNAPAKADLTGLTAGQATDFLARLKTTPDFYEYSFNL